MSSAKARTALLALLFALGAAALASAAGGAAPGGRRGRSGPEEDEARPAGLPGGGARAGNPRHRHPRHRDRRARQGLLDQCAAQRPGLDEAAITAARQWEYEPTKIDGKPVSVRLTVPITFSLALPRLTRQSGVPELRQGVTPPFPKDATSGGNASAEVTLEADGRVGAAGCSPASRPGRMRCWLRSRPGASRPARGLRAVVPRGSRIREEQGQRAEHGGAAHRRPAAVGPAGRRLRSGGARPDSDARGSGAAGTRPADATVAATRRTGTRNAGSDTDARAADTGSHSDAAPATPVPAAPAPAPPVAKPAAPEPKPTPTPQAPAPANPPAAAPAPGARGPAQAPRPLRPPPRRRLQWR